MEKDICGNCGEKMFLSRGPGRFHSYRGMSGFELPTDLIFWKCSACSAEWLTSSQLDFLSTVFEREFNNRKK